MGVISVAFMAPVPGGEPDPSAPAAGAHLAAMRDALRDRNFLRYLEGMGCVTVGTLLFVFFLPLYLRERLAGALLGACAKHSAAVGPITVDGYQVLSGLAVVLLTAGWWLCTEG